MKRIILFLSVLLILAGNCYCQADIDWGTFYLGPFISHKAGLNLKNVYPGEKKIIRINSIPDIGVTCFYTLSKETQNIGIIMELGYSTYSFKHTFPDNENKIMSSQTSCITFRVSYYLWGFSIGPTIGFPINWNVYVSDPNITVKQKRSRFFEGLNLNYFIPLLLKDKEKLNLYFNFELNYITADQFSEHDSTSGYESNYKPSILSFGLGLNYLFKLGD